MNTIQKPGRRRLARIALDILAMIAAFAIGWWIGLQDKGNL